MRQLPSSPKSQPFETILIKENEVTSDSLKRNGVGKESGEFLEGFKLNYKATGLKSKHSSKTQQEETILSSGSPVRGS